MPTGFGHVYLFRKRLGNPIPQRDNHAAATNASHLSQTPCAPQAPLLVARSYHGERLGISGLTSAVVAELVDAQR